MVRIKIIYSLCIGLALTFSLLANRVSAQSVLDYQSLPPFMESSNTPPMVMLTMSVDHQLFFKAYNDFYDINGDGRADTTYNKSIQYIGYFDSGLCYEYDRGVFEPDSKATSDYYCNQGFKRGQWSGNFLNWVSMTRIDVVRKILYGGLRSVDSSDQTILERSHLPNDAHSFAKYYNGRDLGKLTPFWNVRTGDNHEDSGITFCNTTIDFTVGTRSQHSTAIPLIRAARGNHSFWPAGERWQCLYKEEYPQLGKATTNNDRWTLLSIGVNAHHEAPSTEWHRIYDYHARVEACKGSNRYNEAGCQKYPSGNYKPVGILQKYGEKGEVLFGLMSGSYKRNKSGGTLRSNIGSVGEEINIATDGSFKDQSGLIRAIDSFRIANWTYSFSADANTEQTGTYFADNCMWGLTGFNDGECTNWGNPFAEILLESYRYLGGHKATNSYVADDSFVSPNLGVVPWQSPIDDANACTNLNVLAFNSSTISYDGDGLDPSDIGVDFTGLNRLTSELGRLEGVAGGYYFVGKSYGADNDELCTAKKVNALASVRGTCPDAARLKGSYYSSSLAFYAKNNDINPAVAGKQTVNTFGFTLAPSIPKMEIPVPGKEKTITIFPACRNNDIGGNCAIVDFKIIRPHMDGNGDGTYGGLMFVTWEDSEQGGDFDQDMSGVLAYEIDNNAVTIKSRILKKSTNAKMGFGFIIEGVGASTHVNELAQYNATGEGFHAVSGINDYQGGDCSPCDIDFRWASKRFEFGDSNAEFLEQPLFYASKYGGFNDLNESGTPDLRAEWDAINNFTGEPKPDGLPDNYYDVNNPLQLKIQFDKVLAQILEGALSGAGSSVVTNAGDDTGLFIQSLFYPSLTSGEQKLTWVSTLNGLFMDENNQVREDSNSNGALDDSDAIVAVEYEPERKVMMAQRYAIGADGKRGSKQGDLIPINQIKGLWNAESALASVKDYKNQRDYAASANTGRYLFTAIDGDNDGITDAGDSVAFTQSAFAGKSHLLHANNDVALNIIDYIRGTDLPGMRPRMGDVISGNDTLEPWLLGDIANASPVIVGAPKVSYDIEYSDNTYATYRKHYRDRRNMVYAAANDGVLHAFNAGFYDPTKKQFSTDKHPLGSELWGYIPYNLLGHLQWLTDYNYPHVAYLDGQLKSFDVNIFKADEDHPYGWGTILVAGMRFGGGTIEMPKNDSDNNPAKMRSAWVVLDITNPEKPPKLIAEITDDQLGFTTTNVDIVKRRAPSYSNGKYEQPAFNQWYLAFGSGPFGLGGPQSRIAQTTATSTQNAQLFLFDLQSKKLKRFASSAANSFVGGITVTDWNRDYIDDVIYFGTVGGSQSAPSGQLLRAALTLNSTGAAMTFSPVLDVSNQPFSAPPMTRIDNQFNHWVFAGTGRYFHDADGKVQVSNSFYGVKESKDSLGALPTTAQSKSKLIDVSNIQIYTNGEIRTLSGGQVFINGSEPIKNSTQMTSAVADAGGWFINFTQPGSRNVGPASMHLSSLMFTAFAPSTDTCSGKVGSTQLYQRDFFNGLSPKYSAYTDDDKTIGTDDDVSEAIDTVIELGDNYFIEPNEEGLSQSNEGELKEIDLGTPNIKSRRESWREVLKDW